MRILVGMSGGLDSTYAARLLLGEGYEVEGAVLLMHGYTETEEARSAADALGIPLRMIDCRDVFERCVVNDFCASYLSGETPNPCIVCNEQVKFRYLYEEACKEGFDFVATGHYAKIVKVNGKYAVAMANDPRKDQSYMLYRLPQEILSRLLFPLGELQKESVRAQATAEGIAAADRKESQEICFIREEHHSAFIERRCGESRRGRFLSSEGEDLGPHKGIAHYTVGQRKGLGVAAATRLFVTQIDAESGNITLSDTLPSVKRIHLRSCVSSGLDVSCLDREGELFVRLRYTAPLIPTRVVREKGEIVADIAFAPCAVTCGQSAVFYRNDTVMFGGIIDKLEYNG